MDLRGTARRQHGVVSRPQALAAGLTAKQVRWRVDSGEWQRVHRGVYLTHNGTVTWHARAWAGLLWCGSGGVLALDAAAYLWRLERLAPTVITIGMSPGRRPRPVDGVRTVQRRRLTSTSVDGLPVTRLAQTVVDLADRPECSLPEAISLAARACQQRSLDEQSLLAELRVRGRHRHRRQLRLALGEIGNEAESLPEVWFATRVQRPHGLPAFERQVVEDDGTRTDLKSREFGLNVEVDGRLWHAGERFHSDRRRDRRAAARGEVTLRATFVDLDSRASVHGCGAQGSGRLRTPCASHRAVGGLWQTPWRVRADLRRDRCRTVGAGGGAQPAALRAAVDGLRAGR
ncbi:type IV toxin-antitoxin system AbiEi family antitoxin domain-containing protein [Ornithinimicrobium sediminis]|uniref:type IV toxin-antitoxin system AbiEi family antitoxin domain-containing protein n=1 Tax=Ornithinimicrobium sediminis TaxID=2904603 RepID=UPI001E41B8D4|nr:type IV toxin-antitoxin system AbiEi family antitoxin domain-containing protein [Ornithinimicrobium sediminis]